MTQPAIPQVDEEGEKTNPPTTAGEQANASKEAKGTEAAAVNQNAKANEVAEAKKASEDTEKKAKAKKRSAVEAKKTYHGFTRQESQVPVCPRITLGRTRMSGIC